MFINRLHCILFFFFLIAAISVQAITKKVKTTDKFRLGFRANHGWKMFVCTHNEIVHTKIYTK